MRALFATIIIGLGLVSVAFSQTTNVYPKASWAFVGYASPDAALETWTWAFSKGDKKVMLQSLTPEGQKGWQKMVARMTDDQWKAQVAQIAKIPGYTIRKREMVSNEEVVLHIGFSGSDEVQQFDMKKIGSEWKLAGPKRIEL